MRKNFLKILLLVFVSPIIFNGQRASADTVFHAVPSIVQAPTGKWSDSRLRDGCEEASILMVMLWAQGRGVTAAEAEAEILGMAQFEKDVMIGFHNDTSADDTARLMREYYGFANLSVQKNISAQHIKEALSGGSIAIVPLNISAFGRKYYKNSVTRHTVVVAGYDEASQTFIINDPLFWTPRRIKEKDLQNALRNYTSGARGKLLKSSAMIV